MVLLAFRFISLLSFPFCCIGQVLSDIWIQLPSVISKEYFGSGYCSPKGSILVDLLHRLDIHGLRTGFLGRMCCRHRGNSPVSPELFSSLIAALEEREMQNSWDPLKKLHPLIFGVIAPALAFLTALYWAVLYEGDTFDFENVMRHGLSALLSVIDLLMTRIPIVSYHFQIRHDIHSWV